jgi:hypothetical protein
VVGFCEVGYRPYQTRLEGERDVVWQLAAFPYFYPRCDTSAATNNKIKITKVAQLKKQCMV